MSIPLEKFLEKYDVDFYKDKLGHGGMGDVFRGYDKRKNIAVAIKRSPKKDQYTLKEEVRLAQTLNHKNVVKYYEHYDVNSTLGEFEFATLELVNGKDLKHYVGNNALTLDEKLKVAIQILEALEHLHGKSVLHRDLKPSNILLTQDKRVKLIDFGISKALKADAKTNTVTYNIGSRPYMSPETLMYLPNTKIRAYSDLWSFGVLLFELITGDLPFPDAQTNLRSFEECQRKFRIDLFKQLPAPYDKIIQKCLEYYPDQRATSCNELIQILNAQLGVSLYEKGNYQQAFNHLSIYKNYLSDDAAFYYALLMDPDSPNVINKDKQEAVRFYKKVSNNSQYYQSANTAIQRLGASQSPKNKLQEAKNFYIIGNYPDAYRLLMDNQSNLDGEASFYLASLLNPHLSFGNITRPDANKAKKLYKKATRHPQFGERAKKALDQLNNKDTNGTSTYTYNGGNTATVKDTPKTPTPTTNYSRILGAVGAVLTLVVAGIFVPPMLNQDSKAAQDEMEIFRSDLAGTNVRDRMRVYKQWSDKDGNGNSVLNDSIINLRAEYNTWMSNLQLVPVEDYSGKKGYKLRNNPDGEWVLTPRYDFAGDFENGYSAFVIENQGQSNENRYYIHKDGECFENCD